MSTKRGGSKLFRAVFSKRTLAIASGGTLLAAGGGYWYLNSGPAYPDSTKETRRPPPPWTPPSRQDMLKSLKSTSFGPLKRDSNGGEKGKEEVQEMFDILVVGGGATGAGVAVDAASRGLKVALVERDDFSSGTSSKSTKLVHGGVRYLQKAVMELDYDQYKLVKEALHERRIFLQTAPYLSQMLPIMLPIYKYWQVPYYWLGCKLYDVLAGKENMESSYLMSKGKALETFPMLKSDGLVGALVYYDGQHNDSRMNMALVMTAVKLGATVANYCEVTTLHKDASGRIEGVKVRDNLTGEEWSVRAKGVINATGPFSDTLLTLDNPSHKPIVQPSSGIHITLPNYYSPRKMGLLDPATSDGRVIFFLPWQGNTIAGTTDTPARVERDPVASEEDIRWVLEEVRRYLSPDVLVRRGDVLSAWSGLRPLVRDLSARQASSAKGQDDGATEHLVRNHMIHVDPVSKLLTIAGGKWTTYRAMAQETVDRAVLEFELQHQVSSGCVTERLRLVGSDGWSRNMFIGLIQRYGLETDVARHLADCYGDRAWTVLALAEPTGRTWPLYGKRLQAQYPFIDAEVRYAVRHEYAQTAIDVLARRTRLSFLNVHAALEALPRVVDIMADELGWDMRERWRQIEEAVRFFRSMGLVDAAAGSGVGAGGVPEPLPKTTWERVVRDVRSWTGYVLGLAVGLTRGQHVASGEAAYPYPYPYRYTYTYTRARFDAGEVEALKEAFERERERAASDGGKLRTGADAIKIVLSSVPGYDRITRKEIEYVLQQAGLGGREGVELELDEFIEICGNLKEVSFLPTAPESARAKRERVKIPVEKSGGGV